MQQGEPAKALDVLTKGLALDVDRPPFLVKLGEAYIEMKRYDEAEKALSEAVRLRADVPRGQYNLALVQEQRGNATGARAAYEAEVGANPKNYGAQFNLGRFWRRKGAPPRRRAGSAPRSRRGRSLPRGTCIWPRRCWMSATCRPPSRRRSRDSR